MNEEAVYVNVTRGGQKLVLDNFLYKLNRSEKGKLYYRCNKSCKSVSVIVENNRVLSATNIDKHNHPCDEQMISALRAISIIKTRCASEQLSQASSIYREEAAKLKIEKPQSILPRFKRIKSQVYRAKNVHLPSTPNQVLLQKYIEDVKKMLNSPQVEPLPDEPVPDEPLPDEPLPDEATPDEVTRGEVAPEIAALNESAAMEATAAMDFGHLEGVTDFSGFCRLCLTQPGFNNMTQIFCETSDAESLEAAITSLIPIQMDLSDGLPLAVCGNCVEKLGQARAFIQSSVVVDSWLRDHLHWSRVQMKEEAAEPEPGFDADPLALDHYLAHGHTEPDDWSEIPEQKPDGSSYQIFHKTEYMDMTTDGTKKKRGRPRTKTNEASTNKDSLHDEAPSELPKKKRGRPLGSTKTRRVAVGAEDPDWDETEKPPKRPRGRPRGSFKNKESAQQNALPPPSLFEKSTQQGALPLPCLFECTSCLVLFDSKQSVAEHYRADLCRPAGASERIEETLEEAEAEPEPERRRLDGDTVSCLTCLAKFPSKERLEEHAVDCAQASLWGEGDGQGAVWDDEVGAVSDDDDGIEPFDNSDLPPPEKTNCVVCNKEFGSATSLKRHMRYHNESKRFACDQCPKTFTNQMALVQHYRVHTGDRPYACALCPKRFPLQSSLTKHERVHTGEKPYECATCDKTFALRCSLRNHERVHSGEKPFACSFCDKTFATHTTRAVHQRLHTGEKPYACAFCQLTFAESSKRDLHTRRIHTKERTVQCPSCPETFMDSKSKARHVAAEHGGL